MYIDVAIDFDEAPAVMRSMEIDSHGRATSDTLVGRPLLRGHGVLRATHVGHAFIHRAIHRATSRFRSGQ
jgi:hypothetical protein